MKKYIVFIMILGLIVVGAPKAHAVTLTDLQKQIKSLTTQVSTLAAQLTGAAVNTTAKTATNNSGTATSVPCTATTFPFLKIISPNGGETFTVGSVMPITWTSCNVPASTEIAITVEYSGIPATVGAMTTNTGSFSYTIPNNLISSQGWTYGNNFKIFLKTGSVPWQGNNIAVDELSDNTFTINNIPTNGCVGSTHMDLTGDYLSTYYPGINGLQGELIAKLPATIIPSTFLITNIWLQNSYNQGFACSTELTSLDIAFNGHSDQIMLPINISNIKIYDEAANGSLTMIGSYPGVVNLNFNPTTQNYSTTISVPFSNIVLTGNIGFRKLVAKGNISYNTSPVPPTNLSLNATIKPHMVFTSNLNNATVSPVSAKGPKMRIDNN